MRYCSSASGIFYIVTDELFYYKSAVTMLKITITDGQSQNIRRIFCIWGSLSAALDNLCKWSTARVISLSVLRRASPAWARINIPPFYKDKACHPQCPDNHIRTAQRHALWHFPINGDNGCSILNVIELCFSLWPATVGSHPLMWLNIQRQRLGVWASRPHLAHHLGKCLLWILPWRRAKSDTSSSIK